MPHGTPDWGLVGPKKTTYGLDDLGEHAVRLGSPSVWDRRGDVIWQTDFGQGLQGIATLVDAAPSEVRLWAGRSRQGAFSVQLAASGAGNAFARIQKFLPMPVYSRVGVECSFDVVDDMGTLAIQLWWIHTGRLWLAGLRYDHAADRLAYVDAAHLPVVIGGPFNLSSEAYSQHCIKLVADLAGRQYVRAILNEHGWSLSGIGAHDDMAMLASSLNVVIVHYGDGANATAINVDCMIVTQNEP